MALLTVAVKEMSLLVLYAAPVGLALVLVVASVIAFAISTGPVYVCDFRVETLPYKEISVEEVNAKLSRDRAAPTVEPKLIDPAPAFIANVAGVDPLAAT